MRIVIDLQAAQSPGSRHRGIGRYSIALAKAMLRHRGPHEILIALNGAFADTIAPLRETFAGLMPPDDIRVWHATLPPRATAGAAPPERQAAELVREAFLASLEPDIVHVASLFESSAHSVASVHRGPVGAPVAVTLYDLIPYIYPHNYLVTHQATLEYEEKIAHLRKADLLVAISESSRQEGIAALGLDPERVVNISSAADEHFTPAVVPAERELELRRRHKLPRPFVMYTGGIDFRKNVEGLIRAWAALPAEVRGAHQLAIVCAVQPKPRATLEALIVESGLKPEDVVLTGFVSEDDLLDLYRLCKLFVFPSQHEGFGLPALEAMRCGAPVIGSDNSSIPEVIGREDAMFDASSQTAITSKILECLQSDELRASLVKHGLEQATRFSWDHSAQVALEAFERIAGGHRAAAPVPAAPPGKPRLAFVTPMPPQRSGIADSSAELLPHLAAHYEIDLILDQPEVDATAAPAALATCRSVQWFMEHGHEYDRVLYQFGNSSYHAYMFPLLEQFPGTAVLHDFYISGVIAHREMHGGAFPWTQALYRSHGWPALAQRFHAANPADVIYAYPANFEVLSQANGVIVHSRHAQRLAQQWFTPETPDDWAMVPLPRTPAAAGDKAAARRRLGLPADDFIVCSYGLLGPTKANHLLLRAWRASALATMPGCQLLFVGEPQQSVYGRAFASELAVNPGNVRITGWTSEAAYNDYLDAADMAVQLRAMSRGETSAAVLDCMNHGVPAIANREGSMADLDPEAVWLVPQDCNERELARALEGLWRDPARRDAMAQRGRQIVHTLHAPAACAAGYAQAIEAFAARSARRRGDLLDQLAQVLPPDADEPLLDSLAGAIAHDFPERPPARQVLVDISEPAAPAPLPSDEATEPGPAAAPELPPIVRGLMEAPLPGWRVEPVYRAADGEWRYARGHVLRVLGCPPEVLPDDPIEMQPGDLWCTMPGAEAQPGALPRQVAELGLSPLGLPAQGDTALIWAALAGASQRQRKRHWFIDISELVRRDWHSGIQRVVKNYLLELLRHPPADTCVLPVCATADAPGYRVAHRYLLGLAGIDDAQAEGRAVVVERGDVFFALDLQPHVVPAQAPFLAAARARGASVAFMVYDLLPVRLPDCFSPGAAENHARWLRSVAKGDLAICISQAVGDDLAAWLRENPDATCGTPPPRIRAVHLGADLTHSMSTRGLPAEATRTLELIRQRPSFLMVGTLEPRKAHRAVLAAFERLWAHGEDAALVICGRPGWMVQELEAALASHPERDHRLFWIEDSSDEYLEAIYAACGCLIAASLGEGFGLPLIEAAQRGLSIIARDLPVFREVAGDHAFYFDDDGPDALADSLSRWLALHREGRHPRSKDMPWQTWHASAEELKRQLQATDWQAAPALA